MEIAELYQLFMLWSKEAIGSLKLNADGSGSIQMLVVRGKRRIRKSVISWQTTEEGSRAIHEELTGKLSRTKQFWRKNQ